MLKFNTRLICCALISVALLGCSYSSALDSGLDVVSGKVVRLENFPSEFVSARNIDIWLPDDYSDDNEYAVLYMHDGQMLYDAKTTWNKQEWGVDDVLGKLIDEGAVRKTIVVGVWNGDHERHTDYYPTKPFELLPDDFKAEFLQNFNKDRPADDQYSTMQADNYLKFLVEELKPYIDQNFATLSSRDNTFVAGSSMGGLISMYAYCEYPEVFGGAACLSTHWVGGADNPGNPMPQGFIDYLESNMPAASDRKIYFDYGTGTLDSLYETHQLRVDSIMVRKGYDESLWQTIKFEGENHTEISWNKRLDIPLTFLLEK